MDRITRLQTFARVGFLARGIVYMLLGYFALTTASSQGTTGILGEIKDAPGGTVLLVLVGIGLLGYSIFRLYGAAVNIETGTGLKNTGKRIGHAGSGIAHLALAYIALSGAFSSDGAMSGGPGGGSGGGSGEAAGLVASLPGGILLLILVGVGFLLAAIAQGRKAVTANFMHGLDADAPSRVKHIGRAGYAARTVVFVVLGWQVISAAMSDNADSIGGIGDVLGSLRDTQWLYIAVALGLIMFGVFSLVMARYRRIRDEDVLARFK
ncbi:MAG: DUF1206 domain-containing protein [Pacificimonas sp.]